MTKLRVFKTHTNVPMPKHQTEESACFDICFTNIGKQVYKGYDRRNREFTRPFGTDNRYIGGVYLNPFDRVLVPTGLIFDIPEGFSVRIHPRSGLSLKNGLVLANLEGVIDSDYVDEFYIMLTNFSDQGQWVLPGDRLCQGEMVRMTSYEIVETDESPKQKTSRVGGMGSTGVSDKEPRRKAPRVNPAKLEAAGVKLEEETKPTESNIIVNSEEEKS